MPCSGNVWLGKSLQIVSGLPPNYNHAYNYYPDAIIYPFAKLFHPLLFIQSFSKYSQYASLDCNILTFDFSGLANSHHNISVYCFHRDIAEYMGDKVTHIVTDSKWDDNFDEASCLV